MVILDEKGLSGVIKKMVDVIFFGGAGITLGLPFVLKWYLERISPNADSSGSIYYFLLVLLYITGFLALVIVNELRRIFKALNRHDPFIMNNVKSLRRMAVSSLLISFFYIFKIIFYNSFLTIIIVMIFLIAGLFCIILAEVFNQAIRVKEENDLTI